MSPDRNLHYASSNIFMDRAYEAHIHHQDRLGSLGGLVPRAKGKLYSAAGYAATLPNANEQLQTALFWYRFGFRVIPLDPDRPGKCDLASPLFRPVSLRRGANTAGSSP